ncbi:hypothetical protein C7445_106108 [Alicyclobacillus sacchari]|uniref:Inner membrane protein YgaP-like transmembrane domain-containing protein n=1 Tax=Alicyclobacillus sacchari TaxID=392010 RepID=A0A4R8LPY5_9BACL|nr:DUF2892 domain-containing protein [Alicyclobacillus sacchari]TDY46682.1 hypothetical protein C7445_106108 [Alicyclobacillus sacchari]GMA58761.1 hypothetical protein GCM10025858_32640 [Alicyclobacillus sacchari]
MQANLSMADRYFRLATGVISIASAARGRRQSPLAKAFLMGYGAMKVAEGVTGWCPIRSAAQSLLNPQQQTTQAQQGKQQRQASSGQSTQSVKPPTATKQRDAAKGAGDERDHLPEEVVAFLMDRDDDYRPTQH